MLITLLKIFHVLACLSLVGLILLQQGKGADAGAAFGSGASTTVFGARGSANFMTRATAILAIFFLADSLFLTYLAVHQPVASSVVERSANAPAKDKDETTEIKPLDKPPAGAPVDDGPPTKGSAAPVTAPATDAPPVPAARPPADTAPLPAVPAASDAAPSATPPVPAAPVPAVPEKAESAAPAEKPAKGTEKPHKSSKHKTDKN
jgi:preprotein translocase subunit SecG